MYKETIIKIIIIFIYIFKKQKKELIITQLMISFQLLNDKLKFINSKSIQHILWELNNKSILDTFFTKIGIYNNKEFYN